MDENKTIPSDFLVYNESSTEDNNLSIEPGEVGKVNIKFKYCDNCIHESVCKYKDQMKDLSFQMPYIPVLGLYVFCKNIKDWAVGFTYCPPLFIFYQSAIRPEGLRI